MSIKIHFLFILAVLYSIGCGKNVEYPVMQANTPQNIEENIMDTLTYLALGDSYTIGESVNPDEPYPVQLAESLSQSAYTFRDVKIIARTGWTTDELQKGIADAQLEGESYSLVSLLIGVNDQYRGRSVEVYKPAFEELLQQAIKFAGGNPKRVFVLSIPDYSFTPFGGGSIAISQGIDSFNAANKMIAEANGVQYFDITPISREGLQDTELVAQDNLHPSAKQYARWVEFILPFIVDMLE